MFVFKKTGGKFKYLLDLATEIRKGGFKSHATVIFSKSGQLFHIIKYVMDETVKIFRFSIRDVTVKMQLFQLGNFKPKLPK